MHSVADINRRNEEDEEGAGNHSQGEEHIKHHIYRRKSDAANDMTHLSHAYVRTDACPTDAKQVNKLLEDEIRGTWD